MNVNVEFIKCGIPHCPLTEAKIPHGRFFLDGRRQGLVILSCQAAWSLFRTGNFSSNDRKRISRQLVIARLVATDAAVLRRVRGSEELKHNLPAEDGQTTKWEERHLAIIPTLCT